MRCRNLICHLNEDFLALLPTLDVQVQQVLLQQWAKLDVHARMDLLRALRATDPQDADLMTLSRLADYFRCGVFDMVRYTRSDDEEHGV